MFEAAPETQILVELQVNEPDVMWLKHPNQLRNLGQLTRQVLAKIRSLIPKTQRIHLFYAGPTGGAVIVGQQINPRMNPPVVLYQYSRHASPAQQKTLVLTEDLS